MDQQRQPISTKQRLINLSLVGIVSQVGCVTLLIIVLALLGGMFIDSRLQTKPWFTIGLLVTSVPVSLVIMVFLVRAAVKKMKLEKPKAAQEDQSIGN
jgi:F0F1-type ATP synthase assembly protein I